MKAHASEVSENGVSYPRLSSLGFSAVIPPVHRTIQIRISRAKVRRAESVEVRGSEFTPGATESSEWCPCSVRIVLTADEATHAGLVQKPANSDQGQSEGKGAPHRMDALPMISRQRFRTGFGHWRTPSNW